MKISYLWSSLVLLLSVTRAFSACKFWDGTAPFCKGSCPSNCDTLRVNNRGDGAVCWSGTKALCDCCSKDDLCVPNHAETLCFPISSFPFGIPVGVLICKEKEFTRTCSAHICGGCIWLGGLLKRNNDETCNVTDVTYIDPRPTDIIVQGNVTLSEDEIDDILVSRFGPKLTCEQMRNVKVIKFNYTDTTDTLY